MSFLCDTAKAILSDGTAIFIQRLLPKIGRVVKWAENQIALVAKLRFFRNRNFAIFRNPFYNPENRRLQNRTSLSRY